MDGSQRCSTGVTRSVVRTGHGRTPSSHGDTSRRTMSSTVGVVDSSDQALAPVHSTENHDRRTGQQAPDSPPTQEAKSIGLDREDTAAKIIYLAFNQEGYAHSWGTACNKKQWRRAARALINAMEDGII